MVDFSTNLNRGYAFSTEQQRLADEADRAQAEEAQRQIERQRRNAGMAALTERYGDVAGAPTEYGQLTGIEQRGQRFDNEMEDRDRTLQLEAGQRAAAVVDQLMESGATPDQIGARLAEMPDAVFGGPERAAQARAMALRDPSQASALLRGLSGEAAAGPQFGAMDFYDVGGQEVFGRPVMDADGNFVDFEELPFAAQREGFTQFEDPDFPGILLERNDQTGQVRQVARNPADTRGAGGASGAAGGNDPAVSAARRSYEGAVREFNNLNEIIDQAVEQTNWASAGSVATVLDNWFGLNQPAQNLDALMNTIGGNVIFKQIEDMRQAAADAGSRGTGLGQITQRELDILESVMGALEESQSPPQLRQNLRRVQQQLAASMEAVGEAYAEFQAGGAPQAQGQRGGQPNNDIPEGMDAADWEYLTPEERALWQ